MPPKKRHGKPANAEHRGRVTLPRDPTTLPRPAEPTLSERAQRHDTGRSTPAASSRYTPPIRSVRFRPGWHKTAGALFVVLGLAIAVLNDIMLLGGSATILPGGHSELYLLLGVAVASYSTWWFGWFDRER